MSSGFVCVEKFICFRGDWCLGWCHILSCAVMTYCEYESSSV